ncbi:hypothetical protein F2Q68_00017413 [Brassica cretica]|uniref:Uncharacterized protein n=1 Tax=Brassica cretica TaxID=69181 RepID=A0A8S9HMM1_BRACR|nr:hypothetical protein F2Q68_00017413 [Brassica cretica]
MRHKAGMGMRKPDSVQINPSITVSSFDDQVEVPSGVSSRSMGSDQSKFCSILRREVRRTVQKLKKVLSESRSLRRGLSVFFMVKPRFYPSRDQSSKVQSSHPMGFGQVLSDQPAVSRLKY